MNIAIFGGSFDPIHIAHEKIVDEAIKNLDIETLFLIPTFLNPHKIKFHLEPEERLDLLVKNFNHNRKVQICTYEILQSRAVNTIETINYLKSIYDINHIYLIMGSDNYENLHTWYAYEEILEASEIVVAKRDGYYNDTYDKIITLDVDIDISSTILRDNLDLNYVPEKIKEDVKNLWH